MFQQLKEWKRTARRDTLVSWLALRDERSPWYVKAVAAVMALYAINPVDIIPDFVPFSGIVDDLLVIPAAIALMVRLIPMPLKGELTQEAETRLAAKRPHSHIPEIIIVICVAGLTGLVSWLIWFR